MKKSVFFIIGLLLFGASFAQTKKTVAVYVTGGTEEGANDVLSTFLKDAITKSASYVAVERTADFLRQLQKERKYQQSGNVDDDEIARLGRESGAKYVCVAEIMSVQGGDFITARLIDVISASVVSTADNAEQINSLETMMRASENVAKTLLSDADMATAGQAKKRVAVYVESNTQDDISKVLGVKLVSALTQSVNYAAMERTDAFLKQLKSEQNYQQSGNVNEDQIAALGKQFGVQFVCVAKVSSLYGSKFLSASMIDVETANLVQIAKTGINNTNLNTLVTATQTIARELAGKTTKEVAEEQKKQQKKQQEKQRVDINIQKSRNNGIDMVYVEGNEKIKGFCIGKYEVTQAQWQAIMGKNPSYFKGGNNPVEQVSWNDAQEFIKKLNAITGLNYALPTEAQWEYAAREGKNSSYEYSGSNDINSVAWYDGNSGSTTHSVGQKSPNALGIYDMAGNVWEWCQDCYDSSCSYRVYRGGGWGYDARYCRVASRFNNPPSHSNYFIGFRLVIP